MRSPVGLVVAPVGGSAVLGALDGQWQVSLGVVLVCALIYICRQVLGYRLCQLAITKCATIESRDLSSVLAALDPDGRERPRDAGTSGERVGATTGEAARSAVEAVVPAELASSGRRLRWLHSS